MVTVLGIALAVLVAAGVVVAVVIFTDRDGRTDDW